MASLWIIGVYVALAGWVWGAELTQAVGRGRGWWDLNDSPVLGLLLPERTLERVGPRWMPGLGFGQPAARLEDQADFLFKQVDQALRDAERPANAERVGEGGVGSGTVPTPSEVLARVHLAERRIAEVPIEELRRRRDEVARLFGELDGLKRMETGATKVLQSVAGVASAAEGFDAGTADAKARDNFAASLEEVMFSLEDYDKIAAPGDPLRTIDTGMLQAAADAVRDGKPDANPRALLERVREAAGARAGEIGPMLAAKLGEIGPAIERIMPMPTGFDGVMYKVRVLLGTDAQGRSIFLRGLYSVKVAVQVGVVVAIVSVLIGALLGSAAAYFGGWVDLVVTWLYSSLSSLPQLVLLAVLAFMFLGTDWERTLVPVYAALCLTFWIGPCRVIRGEVLKIKELEYAQAAKAIGFGRVYILLRHVLPNTAHLVFINFSLLFIGAVKSEVILTFLGLGIKEGSSWGLMISQSAPEVISGIFWQIGTATVLMLVLVLAFNVLSDSLQDAFDPRHVG